MPEATPPCAATASASSTTSSRGISRSPSATTATLHFTWSPAALAQSGQHRGEVFQTAQVMARENDVDVRRCDHHAERARPEVDVVSLVRVQPHDPVAQPGQP